MNFESKIQFKKCKNAFLGVVKINNKQHRYVWGGGNKVLPKS